MEKVNEMKKFFVKFLLAIAGIIFLSGCGHVELTSKVECSAKEMKCYVTIVNGNKKEPDFVSDLNMEFPGTPVTPVYSEKFNATNGQKDFLGWRRGHDYQNRYVGKLEAYETLTYEVQIPANIFTKPGLTLVSVAIDAGSDSKFEAFTVLNVPTNVRPLYLDCSDGIAKIQKIEEISKWDGRGFRIYLNGEMNVGKQGFVLAQGESFEYEIPDGTTLVEVDIDNRYELSSDKDYHGFTRMYCIPEAQAVVLHPKYPGAARPQNMY